MSDPLAGANRSSSDPLAGADRGQKTRKIGWGISDDRSISEGIEGGPQGYRKSLEFLTGASGEIYKGLAALAQYVHDLAPLPPMAKAGMQRDIDAFSDARTDLWSGQDDKGNTWHFGLPTMEEVQQKVTNPAFGPSPEMTTRTGRIAEGIGENLLGGKKLMTDVVLPAVGSEVAAEAFPEHETLARLIGGIGAPTVAGVPAAAFKHAAIGTMSPRRVQLTKILTDAGVPITGGQATGSKPLKYLEAGPWEGRPANIASDQSRAYTHAILGEAGINADVATPDVMASAYDSLGNEYDQIITRTGGVPLDQTLQQNLLDAAVDFQRLKNTNGGIAQDFFDRAFAAAQANGGVIPADIYKTMSSDISTLMRKSTDPETLLALGEIKESLFDSITRNAGPDLTGEWKDLNRRYRTFKLITKSLRGASEGTNVEGFISPDKFRQTMQAADPNFAMDQSRLAELARGGSVLRDVPQSGTPGRQAFGVGGAGLGLGSLGYMLTKDPMASAAMAAAGGAVGSGIQEGIGRLVASKPVRTAIINAASQPPLPPMISGQGAAWQTLMALQNRLDEGRR